MSETNRFDVAIIGGGIVGAATFYKMQKQFPELSMVLIEKEDLLADHQTGHNSGVIHSGLYYKPGSLKAKNCVEGRRELVAFCQEHGIDHDVCGKVVVATDESELPYLDKIFETGLQNEIEAIELDGGYATPEMEDQLDTLLMEVRKQGGVRKMADLCENLQYQLVNADFMEVNTKNVVGTTLARICTSELFNGMEFDAVVIDEASMASLPYLVIMAARCKKNLVIAGDPMQLPPIALTNEERARKQLEQDIFAYASSADHPDELFQWHDQNPLTTSFFDVQYRLHADLAAIISDVFYDGRLRSHESVTNIDKKRTQKGITRSFRVIDTSKYDPILAQKSKEYGFSPRNEVHLSIVADLVYQLVTKDLIPMEHIGIIVPFRSSVWDIRVELKKKGLGDVEVGTIHTYQGREKRVIIFDTVMTGELKQGRVSHFSVRPFDEKKNGLSVPRLLNVAFSRARGELFVLADMRHIEKVYGNKFLGRLLNRLI